MGISNPLLDKIKRDYAELFSNVKQAVEQVFHEFYVPEEEIGYLVMHFGAAILANKDIVQLKTLVICSSGIGTSKMLATRLQQEFPELKQIQNVSVMEFKKMKADSYQLIISTIPIPDYYLEYILVSPILYKDEIEKIRSFINEQIIINGSEKKFSIPIIDKRDKKNTRLLIEEMQSIQGYAQTIATLLEGFELTKINDVNSATAIINLACKELFANKQINNTEAVVDAINEREKLGGLGIPGTSMALFHARSSQVITQTFTIYVTQKPIEVVGMDQKEMEIKSIILMLSPEETADSSLEVLSYLSSLLIESEESISVFQSDDKEEILAYLTARFDQFFTEKINNLRSV
jgi:mannitol operon transcriptional antiterminator